MSQIPRMYFLYTHFTAKFDSHQTDRSIEHTKCQAICQKKTTIMINLVLEIQKYVRDSSQYILLPVKNQITNQSMNFQDSKFFFFFPFHFSPSCYVQMKKRPLIQPIVLVLVVSFFFFFLFFPHRFPQTSKLYCQQYRQPNFWQIYKSKFFNRKSCETPHLVAVQTTIDLYLQSPLPLF